MFHRWAIVLAAAAAFAGTATAWAHHGWSWAEAEQMQLRGVVKQVQIAPPHPWLDVETANDGVWRVELGNPSQTRRAGFEEGSAKPGDTVMATGNRSQDRAEKRMKAVQISVGGKTYDIYPERIRR
ncbi:MAG: DUF6152 family protein [Pigmentiphaga sp.]|uniref:DUF6152 family protein n=1 Tax=Pigmentiphaga sp. TaxID=1977564 RepID=UPI0029A82C19|nr:DUF6152 family protein [Pigmentiphaga sp.]MDX3907132.1 DUF6152 family protein [Pigmentiphaga sp.]